MNFIELAIPYPQSLLISGAYRTTDDTGQYHGGGGTGGGGVTTGDSHDEEHRSTGIGDSSNISSDRSTGYDGRAILMQKMKHLTDMNLKAYPDDDGNFYGIFDLRAGVFDSGIYNLKATYFGHYADESFLITDDSLKGGKPELVLDLERIREKTKFEKAHFAGHSLGGMIASAYALKFPEHVISVGMLSTVAGRSDEDSKKVWNVIYEMEKNGIEKTLQNLTNRWFTDEFIQNSPDLVERRLKQVVDTNPEVFLNVFKIYAKTEMFPWLKNISKPCLLLTGENDIGCSPKHNEKMAKEIPNSKLVILPKYKHSFLIEAPKEVAESLIEFINE